MNRSWFYVYVFLVYDMLSFGYFPLFLIWFINYCLCWRSRLKMANSQKLFFFFFSLSREYIFMNLSWIDVYVFTFFHIVFCYLLHSPYLCWQSRLKMKNFQKNNGKWKKVYVSMTMQFLNFLQSVMIWFNIFSSCWSWSTNMKWIYHCNYLILIILQSIAMTNMKQLFITTNISLQ